MNEAAPISKTVTSLRIGQRCGVHHPAAGCSPQLPESEGRNCYKARSAPLPRYQFPKCTFDTYLFLGCSPRKARRRQVHLILGAAVTNSHLAPLCGVTVAAIRDSRVGDTWPDHPT